MLTEGTAHDICFPDPTAPCPPPVLLFSPQRYSSLCLWELFSIRCLFSEISPNCGLFFFFLTINYLKLYPTPINKQHCCLSWGFLTFRLFPELPCLFSNTNQANKQGLAITLHWFISAPVFSYGNTEWWRFFYITGTTNNRKKETWNLFEARTPQNSFM